MKKKILSLLLLCSSIYADFDFGECSGSGTFEQEIIYYNQDGKKDYENAATVGVIPAGIQGLKVSLRSDEDVDIRLYGENNDKIVHWPYGIMSFSYAQTKPYKNVPISYSGYNGVDGEKGHEFIIVLGTTPTIMTMKAFGYQAGYATVNYSWTGRDNCSQSPNGTGNFTQTLTKDTISLVGTIPPNVNNLEINLTSEKDLDIQLYGEDGTAIVSWKPTGLIAGATKQSMMYHDMNITWSGYNGTGGHTGHEYITVTPKTTEVLVMKVYGYEAGTADVTYTWGNGESGGAVPTITLEGDENLTMYINQTYIEQNATAVDQEDGNVSVSIAGDVNGSALGTYEITYTATDSDGHTVTKKRYVTVVAPASASDMARDFVQAYLADDNATMEQITSQKMITKLRTIDTKVKKYFNLIAYYPSMKYFHDLKALVVGVAKENGEEIKIKFYFNWVGSHWIMTEVL